MKLERYQLEQLISNTWLSFDGKDLYGRCPYCGFEEFGISLDVNHPFNCFRKKQCGISGNIYTLLKHLGKVKEFLGDREINVEGELVSMTNEVVENQEEIILPTVDPPVGWQQATNDEYLIERGFLPNQFNHYRVGRSRLKKDYVTFLVEMEGRVTGYVSRSIRSKQWIDAYNIEAKKVNGQTYLRYRNSVSDFSRMLFGYDKLIKGKVTDVILVEGIFSNTKTDANLSLDMVDWLKCCATFGAKVSDEQIRLLKAKGVETVWLWFEADVLEKVKQIAAKLSLHFNVKVAFINGFDPGDIDENKAMELLENSVSFVDIGQNYIS